MLDVSSWPRLDESSGSRQGYWLLDRRGNREARCLVKFPKEHKEHGFIRWEAGAEFLAARIANTLGLNVPKVKLVQYNGRMCAAIWDFRERGLMLREGVDLTNTDMHHKVTVSEVIISLLDYISRDEATEYVVNMVCLDILIGNPDRHQRNWGVLIPEDRTGRARVAPYFDHGSSLGSSLPDWKLPEFASRFDRGFRYQIAIDPNDRKRPRIPELMVELYSYREAMMQFLERLTSLTDHALDGILKEFDSDILSRERREFIRELIIRRRDTLKGVGQWS